MTVEGKALARPLLDGVNGDSYGYDPTTKMAAQRDL
jgi:hypothetical protein